MAPSPRPRIDRDLQMPTRPKRRIGRRGFLAAATLSAARAATSRGDRLPTPRDKLVDPLTERELFRLTDPAVLHHLPGGNHRFIARNNSFLLLAAEHGGERQIHRLDLGRRRLTQLTEGPAVHPYAAHLRANDRGFYGLQGDELYRADAGGGRRRRLYACPAGWRLTGDMEISRNERYAALVEMSADHFEADPARQFEREPPCRIRIVDIASNSTAGRSWTAAEERRWLSSPQFRPWRTQVLFTREGPWNRVRRRLQLVNLDGSDKASVRPTRGDERVGRAYWPPAGSHLRFVHFPDADGWRATIRTIQPETRAETTEAPCSAFGWLRENADGSAIVGASRRPSGPNLYVLFPRMRREITLCEHLSSLKPYPVAGTDRIDPFAAAPAPALSEDSTWLYFVTDREGMPALYAMSVEDLVEPTASR